MDVGCLTGMIGANVNNFLEENSIFFLFSSFVSFFFFFFLPPLFARPRWGLATSYRRGLVRSALGEAQARQITASLNRKTIIHLSNLALQFNVQKKWRNRLRSRWSLFFRASLVRTLCHSSLLTRRPPSAYSNWTPSGSPSPSTSTNAGLHKSNQFVFGGFSGVLLIGSSFDASSDRCLQI